MKHVLSLILLAVLFGCGKDEATRNVVVDDNSPVFKEIKDVRNAPAWVQEKAKAVVKVVDWGGSGTGSFLSSEGLLVTNYHVLGSFCFEEGCSVKLAFNRQSGVKRQEAKSYWLEPVFAELAKDLAYFQVYDSRSNKNKLSTPEFLNEYANVSSLNINDEIVCIGFPRAGLKKFYKGRVRQVYGKVISSTVTTLGGASGSPCFDVKSKKLVSVHHSGYVEKKDSNRKSSQGRGRSSSLDDSMSFIEAYRISGERKATGLFRQLSDLEELGVLESENLLRNYGGIPVEFAGSSNYKIFSLKKRKCLEKLNSEVDKAVGIKLYRKMSYCLGLHKHISCRSDIDKKYFESQVYFEDTVFKNIKPFQKLCPSQALRQELVDIYDRSISLILSSSFPIATRIWSVATLHNLLEPNWKDGFDKAYDVVIDLYERHNLSFDFMLAEMLINYGRKRSQLNYQGVDAVDYILNYKLQPNYSLYHRSIYFAAKELYKGFKIISLEEFLQFANELINSDTITFNEYIELQEDIYLLSGI